MAYYYDKHGNIYKLEDEKLLKKKDVIEVFNESGEEFSLPAKSADEFKLTPDEKVKVIEEIKKRIMELAKTVGLGDLAGAIVGGGGGCPAIDPVQLQTVMGTQVLPQQSQLLSNLLGAALGGGCPNVDYANLGNILGSMAQLAASSLLRPRQECLTESGTDQQLQTILGTQILPIQTQLIANLLRAMATQPAAWVQRIAGGGCPNIDPPELGSILGSLAQLGGRQPTNLFERIFGGGCPMIDPYQIGTLMGTLGFLKGLQRR